MANSVVEEGTSVDEEVATGDSADSARLEEEEGAEPPPTESVDERFEPAVVPNLEPAPVANRAGPFAQGNIRVGGSIGWASSFGGGESVSWFILGLGAGIFVLDGLEVHGDVTSWIGDPFIATLTPGVRYVFYQVPTVKPYVGVMYRHYFVTNGYPDTDSVGGRVGLNFMISPNSYFGGGVLVEHFLDQNVWSETPQVYPELMLSLML
jgi:hypothetical protein